MSIKINKLEIENVKRVKAVKMEPTANGLTVIGGKNRQGKTSVLDAIAWALGGNKFRPSEAKNTDSMITPTLHLVMSNGLIIERKGKNSDLKVTDPNGEKGGQQLLDSFVEQLALDLPRFLNSSDSEKAQTLLNIIGVGEQLAVIEQEEKETYNRRHTIGQIADQKKKFAKEQIYYPEAPKDLVSASDLIKQQQELLALNGENQRKRDRLTSLQQLASQQEMEVKRLSDKLSEALATQKKIASDLEIAEKTAKDLQDESTAELEANIANVEEINSKVRINLDKDKAEEDALDYSNQYDELTAALSDIRKRKTELLQNANLPLEGLIVDDGLLKYKGQAWDNMSGADQLIVATAIVRKLNPNCGFVLLDRLEQMDVDTLQGFGKWLEQEGLQAIATRVSSGEECTLYIEDGYVVEPEAKQVWKEGEF